MSEQIVEVEIEIPKNCAECPLKIDEQTCFNGRGVFGTEVQRMSWCPIKGVLPDEHGDLIDRDALILELLDRGIEGVQTADLAEFQQIVMDAKAIIKAERKDDEQIHRC